MQYPQSGSSASSASISPRSPAIHPPYASPSIANGVNRMSLSNASSPASHASLGSPKLNLDESIYIREWRQKREETLKAKDAEEEAKHLDILDKAQKEIEEFYDRYNKLKTKNATMNRETEEKLAATSPASLREGRPIDWKLVFKQIDSVNKPKSSKDTSRMKSILAGIAKADGATSIGSPASAHSVTVT